MCCRVAAAAQAFLAWAVLVMSQAVVRLATRLRTLLASPDGTQNCCACCVQVCQVIKHCTRACVRQRKALPCRACFAVARWAEV